MTSATPNVRETVRQALIYAKDVQAAPVEDEERECRVMAETNLVRVVS